MSLNSFNWIIVNNTNIFEKLPDFKKVSEDEKSLTIRLMKDTPWAFWILKAKSYEILSKNIGEQIRWSCDAQWQLYYYREELEAQREWLERVCGLK